jgi:type VI secretion system secreted protein Hcp
MRLKAKFVSSFALSIALACFSNVAAAALDMYMDIPQAPGESLGTGFQNQIDVLAWSWGASATASKTVVRCNIQDLSFTKWVDKASPVLLSGQILGTNYPQATLTVRTAGANPINTVVIRLFNVRVSSVSTGGSGGEDRLTENVTLHFQSASFTYTPATGGNPSTANLGGC